MTTRTLSRLSVDGGQSGIRLRGRVLTDGDPTGSGPTGSGPTGSGPTDGTPTGEVDLQASVPGILTDRPVLDQVADHVTAFAAEHDVEVSELAVGVSGLTPAATRPERLLEAVSGCGVTRVAVAHDSISGYLAANGTETGVMLAIGTGVVVLAVTESGVAKVDGWGNLIGDAGSGYWIGRAGLEAVMRAFDGRGDETVLTDAAQDTFGALDELYMKLQGDPRRVSRIASFCRTTVEAARDGDAVAARIVASAADELAHSAGSALRQAGWTRDTATRVAAVGSLPTNSDYFRDRLKAALGEHGLGEAVQPPLHAEPIDGVSALLDVAEEHPLRSRIAVAARP